MSFALTLVSDQRNLSPGHFASLEHYLSDHDLILEKDPKWLADHKAAYVVVHDCLNHQQMSGLRDIFTEDRIDVLITPIPQPRIKLLVCDMDSTIVDGETLDDMAEILGIGEKISEITDRSMRGEIDFEQSLKERVELLKDLDATVIDQVTSSLKLMKGAVSLVQTMAKHGAKCVLITGGFTHISEHVAQICGFHAHHANELEIKDGKFTGKIIGEILDASSKAQITENAAYSLGIGTPHIMALGDGANDLEMLSFAECPVGIRPKPILAQKLLNVLHYADLSALLYAQGFKEEEIVHVHKI